MNYVFHPAAEAEHLETVAYLESRKPGLGANYLYEFEETMTIICKAPEQHAVKVPPDIRTTGLKKFPFAIMYRSSHDSIQILAVAHHRRRPDYWLGRI